MGRGNDITQSFVRGAILALTLPLSMSSMAVAQSVVAGQRLGACPERAYLTRDQLAAAAGMALLGNALQTHFSRYRGDANIFTGMKQCARTVRTNVCHDKLLFGLLDPVGSAVGAAAGAAWNLRNGGDTVIGGLMIGGAFGMAKGVVDIALCNKRFAQLEPAAGDIFSGWVIDVDNVREADVLDRIANATRSRTVRAEEGQTILEFVRGVTDKLAN